MSGLTNDFLNNVTRTMFIKVVKNNLYNGSPAFKLLFAAGRVKPMTGTALEWTTILRKHAAVGRFTGHDVFANQPINPTKNAKLSEGGYYAALAISGTEKRKNSGNAEKLIDMVKTQHDNAESTMKEGMYTDLWGDGSLIGDRLGIIGFAAAINTTNIYANIDRSSAANAAWRSNLDTTARTDAELKDNTDPKWLPSVMRTLASQATHDHSPDTIITTKALHNLYMDIYGMQNLRGDNDVADLGFGAVKFSPYGVLMFDDFCTAKTMIFIAKQDWSVYVYDGANFDMPPEGWMRPHNQDAQVTQILWQGQLRLDSPWHQARATNLGG
jgi:hypothetical protein